MRSIFKCQDCEQKFSYNVEEKRYVGNPPKEVLRGLVADECPNCKSVYMDCQNLEECLNYFNNE